MLRLFLFTVLLAALGAGAGCRQRAASMQDLHSAQVTLPGGQKILAEMMVHPTDMSRGMMFRDSLPPDRGMLFIHGKADYHEYWMYQVKIPLDIIWMDAGRRIVEISANTPPCKTKASECPLYGGKHRSVYVLELAGGMAARYGLKEGDVLEF